MFVEYEDIGTVRAGIWNATDLTMGSLMVVLIMEYTRKRHLALFVLNILLILYAVYGSRGARACSSTRAFAGSASPAR